ncbi:carbohydrate-binding domain-containing protein [Cellvibrio fibrivorans]|uniref:Uncharacterized protein n=1 Tax=Cellvibrio fibrivorans TaxID=126350 RepID=A0ABU1V471_9GAMM|nr:carbohydrate-binding domain-containing protein [Cellvibrio fibrivorans]MDR7092123.1 hypothetical protein [Cellvibrio fibrivorans]
MKNLLSSLALLILAAVSTSVSANQCDWYGSMYPLCTTQSSGWGWESNQSCIAATSCTSGGGSLTNAVSGCGITTSGYPQCCNGSASDPDGDGWGWENNQSCVTSKPSTACNWNGINYPVCTGSDSGWGWESNQSCIGKSLCAGGNDSAPKWESLIDGNSFSNYSTFEKHWNYLYPWGSDHNGTARMYGSSANHKQIYLENGNVLVLKATPVSATEGKSKADPYLTIKYHSGAIHAKTQVLVNDQYPNWEVRGEFQAPTSKGTWPAFWLTGAWTWPPELDILEFKGSATNWFNTFRTSSDVSTTKVSVSSPNNWHKYRAWITKVNSTDVDVHYYIDETWYAVHRATGFVGKPMWVIINLQMEGSAGAPGPTSDTYYRARNVYIGRTSTH